MALQGTPILDLFGRLGLDAGDFKTTLQDSIRQMEDAGKTLNTLQRNIEAAKLFGGLTTSAPAVLEFTRLLGDQANRAAVGLDKYANSTTAVGSALRNLGVSDIETRFKGLESSFRTVTQAFDDGDISTRTYAAAIRNLEAEGKKLDNYLAGHAQQLEGVRLNYRELAFDARRLGLTLTATVTAPMVALAVASTKSAGEIEIARSSLTRLTGSAEAASVVIDRVRKLSLESPLSFQQTLEGVRRIMTNLRVDGTDASNIMRVLTDSVSATGGGEESLLRIVKALSDVKNQGFLASQEIRQFANANINVVDIIGKQLGITAPEVLDRIRKKAIDADTAISAIVEGLDKRFGGEALARVNTIPGQLQQLKEQWFFAMAAMGEAVKPIVQALIDLGKSGVGAIRSIAERVAELPTPFKVAAAGVLGLTAAIGPLIAMGGQLGLAFIGIQGLFAAATAPLTLFGTQLTLTGLAAKGLAVALPAIPFIAFAGAAAFAAFKVSKVNDELEKTFSNYDEFKRKQQSMVGVGASGTDWNNIGVFGGEKWTQEMGRNAVAQIGIKLSTPEAIDEKEAQRKAKEAARKVEEAFSTLNLSNPRTEIRKLTEAYNLLSKSLTPLQTQSAKFSIVQDLNKLLDEGAISIRQYTELLAKFGAGDNARIIKNTDELQSSALAASEAVRDSLLESIMETKPAFGSAIELITRMTLAESEFAAITYESTKAIAAMNTELGLISKSRADRAFDAFFGGGNRTGNGAAVLIDDLKTLGVDGGRSLEDMREALTRVSNTLGTQEGQTRIVARAWVNYYRAVLNDGQKLTGQQKDHYEGLIRQLDGASRLERAWRGMSRQISTILTDFGRGVIDIFFPKDSGTKVDAFLEPFRSALKKLSEQGFAKPIDALESVISSIKNATTVADANRIAIRAFGAIGPEIARGLREGTLAGERLAEVMGLAVNSLNGIDEGTNKMSKFKALLLEVRNSIFRVFVEEGAKAIATFVGKGLKTLINSLDGIIQKIPIIGKGLADIFGNTAGTVGKIPNIPTIPGGQLPTAPAPVPPGGIPQTPRPTAPGQGGSLGGFLGGQLFGNILGGIGAAAGVGNLIVGVRQEGTLNGIEHNTRFAQLYLGGRGDQGILGQTFRIAEYTYWTMKGTDTIGARLNSIFDAIGAGGGGGAGATYNFYLNDLAVSSHGQLRQLADEMVKMIKNAGVRGVTA